VEVVSAWTVTVLLPIFLFSFFLFLEPFFLLDVGEDGKLGHVIDSLPYIPPPLPFVKRFPSSFFRRRLQSEEAGSGRPPSLLFFFNFFPSLPWGNQPRMLEAGMKCARFPPGVPLSPSLFFPFFFFVLFSFFPPPPRSLRCACVRCQPLQIRAYIRYPASRFKSWDGLCSFLPLPSSFFSPVWRFSPFFFFLPALAAGVPAGKRVKRMGDAHVLRDDAYVRFLSPFFSFFERFPFSPSASPSVRARTKMGVTMCRRGNAFSPLLFPPSHSPFFAFPSFQGRAPSR